MHSKVKYSYFQIVNEDSKTYLKLVKGETPIVVTEVADYLTQNKIPFNIAELYQVALAHPLQNLVEVAVMTQALIPSSSQSR